MKKKYIVHVIWVVVAIAAFVGGMYYGKAAAAPSFANGRSGAFANASRNGGFAARNGSAGGGFVAGQVVSEGTGSITVALPNGNSEIVFYSSSTEITMPSPASPSDLTAGTNVMVGGTPNSDGSLTAQTIQVRSPGAPGGSQPGR